MTYEQRRLDAAARAAWDQRGAPLDFDELTLASRDSWHELASAVLAAADRVTPDDHVDHEVARELGIEDLTPVPGGQQLPHTGIACQHITGRDNWATVVCGRVAVDHAGADHAFQPTSEAVPFQATSEAVSRETSLATELQADRDTWGVSFEQRQPDGTTVRLDPTTIRVRRGGRRTVHPDLEFFA